VAGGKEGDGVNIGEVLREMRDMAAEPQLPRDTWVYASLNRWADAIEAAMREKDAEIERLKAVANRGGHLAVASAEIERLRADAESCRKAAERLREALAMIATATTEDGCTCDNGYTPMWVAEEALAGKEDRNGN
jgi:hypothetical protein